MSFDHHDHVGDMGNQVKSAFQMKMGNIITAIRNEWTTSGFKIRNLTRIDMLISISLMVLYTLWLFELPRDWEASLKQQGPLEPRQYRVFCFFIYIVALLINAFQFFTAFLLFGSVQQGTKDREDIIATSEYYIALLFMLNAISLLKFYMLFFYLEYSKIFSVWMTLPEAVFHTIEIVMLLIFVSDMKKSSRDVESMGIEKNADAEALADQNQVEIRRKH